MNNDVNEKVFDPVRKRYVALTPEEQVRQTIVHYLNDNKGYPLALMQVEASFTLNGMNRRCDIVIYNKTLSPIMIVECKRPDVPITQKVADQACRYNTVLKVPWLLLTNGTQTLVLKVSNDGSLQQMAELPDWNDLQNT